MTRIEYTFLRRCERAIQERINEGLMNADSSEHYDLSRAVEDLAVFKSVITRSDVIAGFFKHRSCCVVPLRSCGASGQDIDAYLITMPL